MIAYLLNIPKDRTKNIQISNKINVALKTDQQMHGNSFSWLLRVEAKPACLEGDSEEASTSTEHAYHPRREHLYKFVINVLAWHTLCHLKQSGKFHGHDRDSTTIAVTHWALRYANWSRMLLLLAQCHGWAFVKLTNTFINLFSSNLHF